MRNMTSSASARGIAAIVGVGPKLGRSIARKFAHEGYTVAILARDLGGYSLPFSYLSIIKTIQKRLVWGSIIIIIIFFILIHWKISNRLSFFLGLAFLLICFSGLSIRIGSGNIYTCKSMLCREIVEVCGRNSEGGEITSICDTNRLLGLEECEGGVRRGSLAWICGGFGLQCVPAGVLATHRFHRHSHRLLWEVPRRLFRWCFPLRPTGIVHRTHQYPRNPSVNWEK